MNPNFTNEERQLLLTEVAAARSKDSELGSGVVLVHSGKLLCRCDEAEAKLIAKLFNQGEVMRPAL